MEKSPWPHVSTSYNWVASLAVKISPAFHARARVVGVLTAMMIHRFFQSASNLREVGARSRRPRRRSHRPSAMAEACVLFVSGVQERNGRCALAVGFA